MDPVTAVVVSAIAAGAVAGVSETASQAVKDAYTGLKNLLSGKYRDVDVTAVERKPNSAAKRESLAEDLEDAGVGGDSELAEAAVAVLEAVQQHAPRVVVGVDVKNLVAAALEVADVRSTGDGVRVEDGTIGGDVRIHGVQAGISEPPDPRNARS
ncbi:MULTISPECIES: hypothetical protein [unclassified Nocardia]|uniref:hypothetical protein n=1 Tax=unclassified Nocardia TaxID=2637762 RepID=UPI0024A8449B|nr:MULTISPECIES: hypothetical protein [unclassified Nocardia]